MRAIDADALINELNNSHYPGAPYIDAGISIAIGKVCDAPTIEPQRTGKWVQIKESIKVSEYRCSECGRTVWDDRGYSPYIDYPYCHCGAKMEDENEAD